MSVSLASRQDVELEIEAYQRLQSWLFEMGDRARATEDFHKREKLKFQIDIVCKWRDHIRDDIGDLLLLCKRLEKKRLTIQDVIEFTIERLDWEIEALAIVRCLLLNEGRPGALGMGDE